MTEKKVDVMFGKIKQCESACMENAAYMSDFAKKQNDNFKKYISDKEIKKDTTPLYETPHEVIYSEGGMRILSYTKDCRHNTPLLIIPSLINRYYILDLMEDVSFVKFLKEKKVPVYMIDWGNPDSSHNNLTLGHYALKWIDRAVKKVLRHSNTQKATLMGYCMGATMTACYIATNPDKVAGFISLAAPYDFSSDDVLSKMARNIDVEKITSLTNAVSPENMQFGFLLAQPTSFYYKMKSLYGNGADFKRNNTFVHLERWLNDNVAFPGEAYKEYIVKLYKENQLINGKLELDNVPVHLENINVPVVNVIAKKDNIVPENAALSLNKKVSSEINDRIEIDAGHIGVIMGRKAKDAWEKMYEWYSKNTDVKEKI